MWYRAWRAARVVILGWMGAACYYWGPGPSDMSTLKRGKTYVQAKVVFRDGRSLMMNNVRLTSDSLTGQAKHFATARVTMTDSVRVPLADVQSIHVATFSAARTVGLAIATPLLLMGSIIVFYMLTCAVGGCHYLAPA